MWSLIFNTWCIRDHNFGNKFYHNRKSSHNLNFGTGPKHETKIYIFMWTFGFLLNQPCDSLKNLNARCMQMRAVQSGIELPNLPNPTFPLATHENFVITLRAFYRRSYVIWNRNRSANTINVLSRSFRVIAGLFKLSLLISSVDFFSIYRQIKTLQAHKPVSREFSVNETQMNINLSTVCLVKITNWHLANILC